MDAHVIKYKVNQTSSTLIKEDAIQTTAKMTVT